MSFLSIKILRIANPPLNLQGRGLYLAVISFLSFLLAPLFFFVFIFYSKEYVEGAVENMGRIFPKNN
jgi:hypothetical protein